MLTNLITDLSARHAAGGAISIEQVFEAVDDLYDDLRQLQTWCINNRLVKLSEWKSSLAAARRSRTIMTALNGIPKTPLHFIELFANSRCVIVQTDGLLALRTDHRSAIEVINEVRFRRLCRIENVSLKIGYRPEEVDDACEEYLEQQRSERRKQIIATLAYNPNAAFDWIGLAHASIETDHTATAEFAATVMRHFVWQVKRKQFDMPVTNHLMMIFGGAQNVGKSTFAKMLFSPVDELTRSASFSQLTDDRIIELWSAAVIFMDEMAFASKSDADEVKNVITASRLDRRPMRSNNISKIKQNATLIGTTNQILAQIIRDTTGTRRFILLPFKKVPVYAVINDADYLAAWQSVDENGEAPIATVFSALQKIQGDARLRSTVEQWIETMTPFRAFEVTEGKPVRKETLFRSYSMWCDDARIAARDALDQQAFQNELRRLAETEQNPAFILKKTSAFTGWLFTGTVLENTPENRRERATQMACLKVIK